MPPSGRKLGAWQVADLAVIDLLHDAELRIPRHERAYLSLIRAGTFTRDPGPRSPVHPGAPVDAPRVRLPPP